MSIIRRYMDYMDRRHVALRPYDRGLSLGGALFCAAAIGYVLGADRIGPAKAASLLLFTGLLLGSLQDLVTSRWLRSVVLPISSTVVLLVAAVIFYRV